MISHTVYMWHPIHYIYYIVSTMYDKTTLCVFATTLGICVTSFAWWRYHIHSITPNHGFYDVPSTLRMISLPLYQTPHPLYLFHHNLTFSSHTHFSMTSYPLYVWHHIHSIEHHINSLCHPTTVLITLQPPYMKPHPVCRATYTLYMWHYSH